MCSAEERVRKTVVRQTNEEEAFSVDERPPSGILLIIYY